MNSKRIYLEPTWKLHSFYRTLIDFPPEGYDFISACDSSQSFAGQLVKTRPTYAFDNRVRRIVPVNLIKSLVGLTGSVPAGTSLTYAIGHVILREEPWIVDAETASILTGQSDLRFFVPFQGLVMKALLSKSCKKVICWTNYAKRTLLNLRRPGIEEKLRKVSPAVQKKDFVKETNGERTKILFVGSANLPGNFELKGGNIVLQAFSILQESYDNIQLILRTDMPVETKIWCSRTSNIRVLDGTLPLGALEREFAGADIFVFPSHNSPLTVFMDAMSFGLPIVATDVDANPEFVQHGKNGFLVAESRNIRKLQGLPGFWKAIRTVDPEMARQVAEKIGILIDKPTLRRSMGRAGREEVERGRFSISRRNDEIKQVLDEATAPR